MSQINNIDKYYLTAIKNGALGGKLIGAGGEVFTNLCKKKYHKKNYI